MKAVKDVLLNIDRLIREGEHSLANDLLNQVLQHKIAREFLVDVASFARRLSRATVGVKLLNPIVRPPDTKKMEASIEERVEYAGCLIRLGIFREALLILDTVVPKALPRSLLFRAFAHIGQWDFLKSKSCLELFLQQSDISFYESLVAKVNLALGYVFNGAYADAKLLLDELCETTLGTNNQLLYSNCLELAAQTAILSGEFAKAENLLAKAEKALVSSDTIDAFFIKKDRCILDLYRTKNSKSAIDQIKIIKKSPRRGLLFN
jgi:hypothetical protein